MLQREIDASTAADIAKFEAMLAQLPGGRHRRGRLPRLPAEQRHLRPAPGRPQPDGAGEDPLRRRHARPARAMAAPRRHSTPGAGATSPPGRTSSSTSCSWRRSPRCMRLLGIGGHDHPRGVRRHRPQRAGLPPRRGLPVRGARHHARGPRRPSSTSCATRSPSGCPASSRSTSRAAPPTAARPCSTTSASSPPPARSRTAPSSRASGCSSPAASAPTPTRRWRSRSSPHARSCSPTLEAVPAGLRPQRQPRQQAAGPHEVAGRHARLRGASRRASSRSASLLLASSTWPGGIPEEVEKHGDAPAGVAVDVEPTPMGHGTPGRRMRSAGPYERWEEANVVRGAAKGTVSAYA